MHTCSWLGSLHPRAWAALCGCLEADWSFLCFVQVVPSHPAYSLALSVFDLDVRYETEPGCNCCSMHTPHVLLHCTLTALH
jgi:hypothetical protein